MGLEPPKRRTKTELNWYIKFLMRHVKIIFHAWTSVQVEI
jgi:hypothetical protein